MSSEESDTGRGQRLADLFDDREGLLDLREEVFKPLAAELRENGQDVRAKDLLALTTGKDTAYILPSNLEVAEWFADIYETEGEPEIHPRGMHYRILGKGYERRNGDPYVNNNKCWEDTKNGAFWARVLGLVPADRIRDEKNPNPQGPNIEVDTQTGMAQSRTTPFDTDPITRTAAHPPHIDPSELPSVKYSPPRPPSEGSPPYLWSDPETLIDQTAEALAEQVFDRVRYNSKLQQDYLETKKENLTGLEIVD